MNITGSHAAPHSDWLERLLQWAHDRPDIRAVVLTGSRSRREPPADRWSGSDRWSDFDLMLICLNPQPYLEAADWLTALGEPLFSIVERSPAGALWERRVLFASGLDADFMVLSPDSVLQNFPGTPVPEILQRGRQVLLDKDGLFASWDTGSATQAEMPLPSPEAFAEVVNDFWFHAVWTAKKLRRGELWVATTCTNAYMKRLLLQMLEWTTRATLGSDTDVFYDGRHMEQWAPAWILEALPAVAAHYDTQDVWRALQASMALFHRMALQTAERWRYPYPTAQAEQVAAWVAARHSETD